MREKKTAADAAAIEAQADAAWQACEFALAAKLIDRIPDARRSDHADWLQEQSNGISLAQATARDSLKSLTPDADIAAYDAAIGQAKHYQSLLEQWSLTDKRLEETLPRYLHARASLVAVQEKEEQQRRRTWMVMLSAAAVLVAVVAATGVTWARSAYRVSQVASAISQRRWDDALAIEPQNATALVGRAVANLEGTSEAIAAALKDLEAAAASGTLLPEVSASKAQAIASRGREHAKAGRLADAEKDYAESKRLLKALPPEMLEKMLPNLRRMPSRAVASLPPIRNSLGMTFRFVPSGQLDFQYTSRRTFKRTVASVAVQGFLISEHEITQSEYREVMGAPPRSLGLANLGVGSDEVMLPASAAEVADNAAFPAMVAMSEAMEFCRRLSEIPGEKGKRQYRLPHEEEWEHACCLEAQLDSLLDYAWLLENSEKQFHRVATRQPNAFGLFDTIGNADEWVAESSTPTNYPDRFTGLGDGNSRGGLHYGGSFAMSAGKFQSSRSAATGAAVDFTRLGFRVAMDAQPLDSATGAPPPNPDSRY